MEDIKINNKCLDGELNLEEIQFKIKCIDETCHSKISDSFKKMIDAIEHTLKTLCAIYWIFDCPWLLKSKYEVSIDEYTVGIDRDHLLMLMWVHDFYKLKESPGHASKGADLLDQPDFRALVRFHDLFGIIHTGEAPLLALKPIIDFAKYCLPDDNARNKFLNTLLIVTIADAASYCFLNKEREKTYKEVIQDIKDIIGCSKDLRKLDEEYTAKRLKRLIESNNRCQIDVTVIEKALEDWTNTNKEEKDDFIKKLSLVRFDAGVYVLEPLLKYIFAKCIRPIPIKIKNEHKVKVFKWLKIIKKIIDNENVSEYKIVSLNEYSIKDVDDLGNPKKFEKWAEERIKEV